MSNVVEQAAQRHRRMQSIIVTLQFLNNDIDLGQERFELLEMLLELIPEPPEIQAYLNPVS